MTSPTQGATLLKSAVGTVTIIVARANKVTAPPRLVGTVLGVRIAASSTPASTAPVATAARDKPPTVARVLSNDSVEAIRAVPRMIADSALLLCGSQRSIRAIGGMLDLAAVLAMAAHVLTLHFYESNLLPLAALFFLLAAVIESRTISKREDHCSCKNFFAAVIDFCLE